jgi:type I restriction-modification system DNA methylase subunit
MGGGKFDAVVMNPPFSHKFTNLENAPIELHRSGMRMGYWFLTQCMLQAPTVIALMPWFTISDSDVRMRALKRHGIKSITALPRKTFQFARIQTMVIHLEVGFKGQTLFFAYDCLNDLSAPKLFV